MQHVAGRVVGRRHGPFQRNVAVIIGDHARELFQPGLEIDVDGVSVQKVVHLVQKQSRGPGGTGGRHIGGEYSSEHFVGDGCLVTPEQLSGLGGVGGIEVIIGRRNGQRDCRAGEFDLALLVVEGGESFLHLGVGDRLAGEHLGERFGVGGHRGEGEREAGDGDP